MRKEAGAGFYTWKKNLFNHPVCSHFESNRCLLYTACPIFCNLWNSPLRGTEAEENSGSECPNTIESPDLQHEKKLHVNKKRWIPTK
mgnify:CR=1 FL=1